MRIETQLEFKAYLRLLYILTYRKPIMILVSIIGVIMLVLSCLYFAGFKSVVDEPPYFQLFFGLFMVLGLPFSVYRSAKKGFSSNGRLQEPIVYEFTEDGIRISGTSFQSQLDWEKTYKVVELKDWILIYQNKLVANVIPKDSFGDNLRNFRELILQRRVTSKLRN